MCAQLYGLVGQSGTGKSHHAQHIAQRLAVDCLIDDGLLIYHGHVRAGYSAKFELNKLAATRRALFMDPNHRDEVGRALSLLSSPNIMVLGTSRQMILLICKRLGISSEPLIWVDIADLLSASDMNIAAELRSQGRHAIPLSQPSIQTSGKLAFVAKRILRQIRLSSPAATIHAATPMVVRPIFVDGSIYITERALRQTIRYFMNERQCPFEMIQMQYDPHNPAHIQLSVRAAWQTHLIENVMRMHQEIGAYLQANMGFPYPQVDIRVETIHVDVQTIKQTGNEGYFS